jgi:hypothetical protein
MGTIFFPKNRRGKILITPTSDCYFYSSFDVKPPDYPWGGMLPMDVVKGMVCQAF